MRANCNEGWLRADAGQSPDNDHHLDIVSCLLRSIKLFYSLNSPYARIARIAARESGIIDEITEIPSKNREPDNPVLEYSPVGRVPTLVDGNLIITETKNVHRYIGQKSG